MTACLVCLGTSFPACWPHLCVQVCGGRSPEWVLRQSVCCCMDKTTCWALPLASPHPPPPAVLARFSGMDAWSTSAQMVRPLQAQSFPPQGCPAAVFLQSFLTIGLDRGRRAAFWALSGCCWYAQRTAGFHSRVPSAMTQSTCMAVLGLDTNIGPGMLTMTFERVAC